MRLYPAEGKIKTPYDWLSIFAGIKFFPYEEDKAKYFYYKKFTDELNEEISKLRTSAPMITPEEHMPVMDITKMKSAYKDIYKEAAAEKHKIYKIEELLAILELTGTPKTQVRELGKELKKPYEEDIAKLKDVDLMELDMLLREMGIIPEEELHSRYPEFYWGESTK